MEVFSDILMKDTLDTEYQMIFQKWQANKYGGYYLEILVSATRGSGYSYFQVCPYLKRKQLTPQQFGYIQDQGTHF